MYKRVAYGLSGGFEKGLEAGGARGVEHNHGSRSTEYGSRETCSAAAHSIKLSRAASKGRYSSLESPSFQVSNQSQVPSVQHLSNRRTPSSFVSSRTSKRRPAVSCLKGGVSQCSASIPDLDPVGHVCHPLRRAPRDRSLPQRPHQTYGVQSALPSGLRCTGDEANHTPVSRAASCVVAVRQRSDQVDPALRRTSDVCDLPLAGRLFCIKASPALRFGFPGFLLAPTFIISKGKAHQRTHLAANNKPPNQINHTPPRPRTLSACCRLGLFLSLPQTRQSGRRPVKTTSLSLTTTSLVRVLSSCQQVSFNMATTDSKPTLSALTLKTPLSATYPSELRSPMVGSMPTPTFIKREESLKTPITPPTAYLDFLKTLSPVLMSPMPTGTSSKFVFEGNRPTSLASVTSSASSGSFTSTSAPADKESPASSRASSTCNCDKEKEKEKDKPEPPMSAPPTKLANSVSTVTIPPPSPFTRPQSARTPRLYIPQSPFSPSCVRSPASAHSVSSPYSAVSPKSWDLDRKPGRTRRVSVREVVTRTVTYSNTNTPVDGKAPNFPQIDPAPRGKRRKLE